MSENWSSYVPTMTINSIIVCSLLLWIVGCADAPSLHVPVSAQEGSSAVLPCSTTVPSAHPPSSQVPHIEWRYEGQVVFERSDGGPYAGKGYEGRVDVPEDKLRSGDCSLVLKDVKLTDEGDYHSFLIQEHGSVRTPLSQSVSLSVKEKSLTGSQHNPNAAGLNRPSSRITALSLLSFTLYQSVH